MQFIEFLKTLNPNGFSGATFMALAAFLIYSGSAGWPWFLACAFVLTIMCGINKGEGGE